MVSTNTDAVQNAVRQQQMRDRREAALKQARAAAAAGRGKRAV